MEITLKKGIVLRIGVEHLVPFGLPPDWTFRKEGTINLAKLSAEELDTLEDLIERADVRPRKKKPLLNDIVMWKSVRLGKAGLRPTDVKSLQVVLEKLAAKTPGRRFYSKKDVADEEIGSLWLPYYLIDVVYHPPQYDGNYYSPPYTTIRLAWEELGKRYFVKLYFHNGDCSRKQTVEEILSSHNIYPESPEFRAAYLKEYERYKKMVTKIGRQYLAWGVGTDNLDGNPTTDDDNNWWWRNNTQTLELYRDGSPSKVVVDIVRESSKSKSDDDRWAAHSPQVEGRFWHNENYVRVEALTGDDDDDNSYRHLVRRRKAQPTDATGAPMEIPVHCVVPVFDLSRHLRLRVYSAYLRRYKYDNKLSGKLVLPAKLKALVNVLLRGKDKTFKDIVKGKGAGSVVILGGPPGVGKTLTAEVYSESEERPLYSVQCSQLGLTPNELEASLMTVFHRAARWNAVLLLDEADVYMRRRGDSLIQNSIVGVFLRVLEYQKSILFLTTNRPEDIDDAIASRAVAKLTYPIPSPEKQKEIWKVLADSFGVNLPEKTISAIVKKSPNLTGRDVKHLLKLAVLMAGGKPVTPEIVESVKLFKPTTEDHEGKKTSASSKRPTYE